MTTTNEACKMDEITCECGHSKDIHKDNGCYGAPDTDFTTFCSCEIELDNVVNCNASHFATLEAAVKERDETIKELAKALYDINHMIVGIALVSEPTESIKAISFYALRKLAETAPKVQS